LRPRPCVTYESLKPYRASHSRPAALPTGPLSYSRLPSDARSHGGESENLSVFYVHGLPPQSTAFECTPNLHRVRPGQFERRYSTGTWKVILKNSRKLGHLFRTVKGLDQRLHPGCGGLPKKLGADG